MPRPVVVSRSSLALDNLRAIVVLIVLAVHSLVAYVKWIPPRPPGFDAPPYGWRAFPIVDSHRWFGFDLFCAWPDIYLISLMFLLSGLFVWPSLARKQSGRFIRDRLLRLGVPFAFGVLVLIPVALYPVYLVAAPAPNVQDYLRQYLALPFVPNGPLWFLWQLLVLNFVAIGLHWIAPDALKAFGRWSAAAGQRPAYYFGVLVAASAIVYIPMAAAFTPWAWNDSGPLTLQLCRPLLYAVYFFAGLGIGVQGIDGGLLAADGALARRWAVWLGVALVSLFAWMGVTALTLNGDASVGVKIVSDLCFVLACASGAFFFLAVCLRFTKKRSPVLASLSICAYGMYVIHYDFVVWLQYALLTPALLAVIKGAIVFVGVVTLSWITTLAAQRTSLGARLIGATPPTIGATNARVPSPAR